ncbi:hypothetical protein [Nocardioides rubriscoriae]|uniref:hypothetical protein n=1 Tax=Nocardioides rubriscoriae TaxID=642762 RepID=UPI0011E06101|nr:hypothetical protein [Nocardioides rubriscoriae]
MSPAALVLIVLLAAHVVLLVVLIALVALDRVRVPAGGIWMAILFLVPVLGPLTVLHRGRRSPVE